MMLFREAFDVLAWRVVIAERHARAGRTDVAESTYRKILIRHPRRAAVLAGLGRLLLRERRFEEAVEIWQRVAEIEPQRSGPRFQLARALHRCGRLEAAASQYLHVLALDPMHEKAFEALEQLSQRLARSGGAGMASIDAAIALAQQMLAQEPGSTRMRGNALALMASLRSRTDPDAAAQDWERLAAQDPRAVEPLLQIARIRRRQHRNEEACRSFQAVLEREPDHAEALLGYGQALAESDPAAAMRHFAQWAERRPRDLAPRLELALRYQKAHDRERAEAMHREILDRLPVDRQALMRLAQILSRDPARLELALELWHRVAERDPKAPLPFVQRAQLLDRARRPVEAESEYHAALARAPGEESALIGLARLLVKQERWGEAVPLFEAASRVNTGRSDVPLGLGRCLERLDRTSDALAAYDKVLAIDPADANALLYRGRLLRQLGRTAEAIEAWRDVCMRSPQNADAWHELVFMLASAERDAEALAALDAAEAALPPSPASWTRLGLAAQAGQFHDRAIGHFERAIAAEPHEAAHHARLGQCYLRQGIVDGAFRHLLASRELRPDDVAVTRQLVDTVHALDAIGVDHMGLHAAPARCGEILAPERLFRRVREIADAEIVPYEPVPRRIIAVTASLAAGGAERQLVTLLRGLSDPAFGLDLSLFCISLARRGQRDFFLPMLADTAVEVVTPVDDAIESCLFRPEVAPHGRLIRAFPPEMAGPIAFWLGEFRRRRPQVVHAWQDGTSLSAAVAALLAGVPRIVISTRSVRPDNPRRRLKRFMREAYQAVLGHPSVVLTNNSRAGADDYADWLSIDPATVEVIYNGIDLDRMARGVDPSRARGLRQSLGVPRDAPIVGSAFRMSEEKRPLLWVEAAAAVARQAPRAHFIVHGDGPMRVDMAALARRLGIDDRLHLPGPEDDMGSCYKAMDVVMLTSRHEGLPNVLLEAQSLGVPVVAPDVGGTAETVWQGVTGWAVRDADALALADRVLHCLANGEWAARARAEGPGFVHRRFGMAAMLRRTLDVYGLATPGGAM
ncbi:MAG: tetratricopeptide repeat protein [Reyranella sp.]|uniref:tetratricopeptide repeat protein n=1 Tax=Reyranella sp. TaxID=1929291 RepID=UPI003D13018F